METAYRIDILARSGIILLLPLGLHLGFYWNVQPYGGAFLTGVWAVTALWLGLTWAAFLYRESDRGLRLTKMDEALRFVTDTHVTCCRGVVALGPWAVCSGSWCLLVRDENSDLRRTANYRFVPSFRDARMDNTFSRLGRRPQRRGRRCQT